MKFYFFTKTSWLDLLHAHLVVVHPEQTQCLVLRDDNNHEEHLEHQGHQEGHAPHPNRLDGDKEPHDASHPHQNVDNLLDNPGHEETTTSGFDSTDQHGRGDDWQERQDQEYQEHDLDNEDVFIDHLIVSIYRDGLPIIASTDHLVPGKDGTVLFYLQRHACELWLRFQSFLDGIDDEVEDPQAEVHEAKGDEVKDGNHQIKDPDNLAPSRQVEAKTSTEDSHFWIYMEGQRDISL